MLINNDLWLKYFKQIQKGKFFDDVDILKIANEKKWTIAHEQAKKGWTTENEEILCLADFLKRTVAHIQAQKGWTTNNKKILQLTDLFGITVAHYQALFNKTWTTQDKDILKLTDKRGWSVAHTLVYARNWYTDDPDILALTDETQKTVLILQMQKGYIPDLSNSEIRKIFEKKLKENFSALIDFYSQNPHEIFFNVNKLYHFFIQCKNYYPDLDISNIPLVKQVECRVYVNNFFLKKLKNYK